MGCPMSTPGKTERKAEPKPEARPPAARRDPLEDAPRGSGQGEFAAAREKFDAALQIRRAIGDRIGEADTLHQLGTIDVYQGDYTAAREKFAEALQIRRAIGDRKGEADTLHQLGTIDLNQPADAQELPRRTIRELAVEHLKHPDEWLDHPNPQFGGRTPNQMIAAGHEDKVRNLFYCAEYGLF